jgi:hypothetical protein
MQESGGLQMFDNLMCFDESIASRYTSTPRACDAPDVVGAAGGT